MEEGLNLNQILSPSDVSTLLRIKESTLRKYALILKDAGYHFDENERGQRAYYERDVITLKKLIEIKKSPDMTLEQAASAVMTWLEQSNVSVRDMSQKEIQKRYDDDIKELKNVIEKQSLFLQEIVNQMKQEREHRKQLQEYIKNFLENDEKQRKHDRELIESLRESQEIKQQLLELAAAHEEDRKKGFFSRLFGK